MKQVVLSGGGRIEVLDAPLPGRMKGTILVRTALSAVSSGTEGAAVTRNSGARGLIEKATASRDKLDLIWQLARTQGVGSTLSMVKDRVGSLNAIGYSAAGRVIEVDDISLGFRPGDRVAVMGTGFANHAEYLTIPKNLAVVLPANVSDEDACFAGLSCIAMQGIRRLELTPGERVCVVGLGLLGQMTMRMLSAMGYQPFGTDISAARVAFAKQSGFEDVWSAGEAKATTYIRDRTDGQGLDGIIITAATDSDKPVNDAFDLLRTRGRVSIVGDVGLNLERARMYRKELELRLSCSYGPGRYDDEYEIGGRDYPIAHARWTERRNLEHVMRMISTGRLSFRDLLSLIVDVESAKDAYAAIKSGKQDVFGVALRYSSTGPDQHWPAQAPRAALKSPAVIIRNRPIRIGLVGIGGFAKAVHLPNLKTLPADFTIAGCAARSGASVASVASKFGVPIATTDTDELISHTDIDAILVATRHASHGSIALKAVSAGKHVFIEKPMTTTVAEGQTLVSAAAAAGVVVRVGFNRRFSPWLVGLKSTVGNTGRRMLHVRSNVGDMASHWSSTAEEGGRLMGEGVHFLDVANWFMDQEPVSISAAIPGVAGDARSSDLSMIVDYADGSSATIMYTTLGSPSYGKEFYEAFGNARAAAMDDFRTLKSSSGKTRQPKLGDKGHVGQLVEFADAILGRSRAPDSPRGADQRAGLIATWMAEAARRSAGGEGRIVLDV